MIAPEGFTEKPFNRTEFAAKLRQEMAEYGQQRADDARAFWFPLGVVLGAGAMALLSAYLEYKFS